MAVSRIWLAPVIVLATLLLGIGAVAKPVSAASQMREEAVLIPGASPLKWINPFYPLIAASYPYIGVNFHDDDDPQVVRYSQDPFATNRALLQGVERADVAVREIDGQAVVIGESMGSMVASRLAAELADSVNPPSPNALRFVLIASPEEGVAKYFREGTYIPLLNYTVSRVAQSPYPTTVVIGEYDFWADPPDRPWNLVALANAAMGLLYVHGPASWDVVLDDVPPENITVDGTVTRYFVPTEHLPLTRPFRDLGVPDCLVDAADEILRPIVDAGYRRHDQPGDSRPYLYDGRIRRDFTGSEDGGGADEEADDAAQRRQPEEDGRLDGDDSDASDSAMDPDTSESATDADEPESAEDPDEPEAADDPDEPESAEDPDEPEAADDRDEPEAADDPAQRQEVG